MIQPTTSSTSVEAEKPIKTTNFETDVVINGIDHSSKDDECEDQVVNENSISPTHSLEKHVGFNVNNENDPNSNDAICRLRRHDTPHYLKGARINSNKQLEPDEIKQILERYTTSANKSINNQNDNCNNNDSNESSTTTTDTKNENKKIILSLKITRNAEKTLGISIVTTNDDNDAGVFITKTLPNGLAAKSGLCVGDKILKVKR